MSSFPEQPTVPPLYRPTDDKMSSIQTIEGNLQADSARFCLLVSRWNRFIVDHLEAGAIDTLRRHGADDEDITIVRVPGAFELGVTAANVAPTGRYDAIIALGAVIRGSTPHFDYISGDCISSLSATARETRIPVIFGVLTVDNIDQAIERAGSKAGNKGSEAAATALEMVNLLRKID